MKYPWFRFYPEALDDLKMERVASIASVQKALVLGAWVGLLSLASDSPERGKLLISPGMPLVIDEMAKKIGIDADTLQGIICALEILEMAHWDNNDTLIIANWEPRQPNSDHSRERVRKHREQKQCDSNSDVTRDECYSDAIEKEEEIEEDADVEEEEEKTLLSASADYHAIRQRWRELFPEKPQPRANNKTLQGKTRTRMASKHFRDNWGSALIRASTSKFLEAGSWFDLAWFLENDMNYEKCLNGNYDDKKGSNGNQRAPTTIHKPLAQKVDAATVARQRAAIAKHRRNRCEQ